MGTHWEEEMYGKLYSGYIMLEKNLFSIKENINATLGFIMVTNRGSAIKKKKKQQNLKNRKHLVSSRQTHTRTHKT